MDPYEAVQFLEDLGGDGGIRVADFLAAEGIKGWIGGQGIGYDRHDPISAWIHREADGVIRIQVGISSGIRIWTERYGIIQLRTPTNVANFLAEFQSGAWSNLRKFETEEDEYLAKLSRKW